MKKNSENFSFIDKTSGSLDVSELPLLDIKNQVLGADYDLSIAVVDDETIKIANRQYRDKDKSTNVLAFPLSNDSGEILLSAPTIKREHEEYDETALGHFARLFIHGLLHLKGHTHGSTMNAAEEKIRDQFEV